MREQITALLMNTKCKIITCTDGDYVGPATTFTEYFLCIIIPVNSYDWDIFYFFLQIILKVNFL